MTQSFSELKYDTTRSVIYCRICNPEGASSVDNGESSDTTHFQPQKRGVFKYEQIPTFDTGSLTREFRNVKSRVKNHFLSEIHRSKLKENIGAAIVSDRFESRNKKVGMNCGRWVYSIVSAGRPYEDYPRCLATATMNGEDCGNLNHSFRFCQRLVLSLGEVVEDRVKKYFKTPMEQTGRRPPVKIVGDKDTRKHRTRQLVALTSPVCDSDNLIHTQYSLK